MKTIIVRDLMTIVLGVQGENEATQVRWPGIVPKYKAAFGDGVYTLVVMRPKDTGTYPVAVSIDGDDLVWVVSGADTAQAGSGKCELIYTVNDVIAKSQTWATRVSSSISGDAPGEPPENPAKAWFLAMQAQIGDLSKLATKAKDNLVAAINEAAKTGSGGAGSISMRTADGYIQYSTDDGTSWENLIAIADLKGEPGEDGAPGADGITPHIGETGNWYLGDVDTGRPSRGAPGAKGDPGKDGAGMDITSATVGQIAKISAVDDNGVPTAWEPVDVPSGGGGGGGSFSNDLLAEGTITSGAATWTNFQTGLTIGDLRKYKSFIILVTGTISGYLYYQFGANVGRVKNACIFAWEDDQKTILRCDGYSQYTDMFSNNYRADLEYWGTYYPWIRFDFRNVPDSKPIGFSNGTETTTEVAYKIMGWIK